MSILTQPTLPNGLPAYIHCEIKEKNISRVDEVGYLQYKRLLQFVYLGIQLLKKFSIYFYSDTNTHTFHIWRLTAQEGGSAHKLNIFVGGTVPPLSKVMNQSQRTWFPLCVKVGNHRLAAFPCG